MKVCINVYASPVPISEKIRVEKVRSPWIVYMSNLVAVTCLALSLVNMLFFIAIIEPHTNHLGYGGRKVKTSSLVGKGRN